MKIRLYLAILLFIWTPSSSLIAQLDINQLAELEGLVQGGVLQGEEIIPSSIIEEEIERERSRQREERESLDDIDENYGYTGGNDFTASPQARALNQPLKYFGYDYFIDSPTTFAPVTDIPIPTDYILGPGDEIKIILYGNKNQRFVREISRDGDIFFPEIGPVSVAGLTFLGLKETIQQIVDNQIIGTKFGLTLGSLKLIKIFVLGEASQPGMYTVSSLSTLTNAVFASGGIKITGSLRNIQVKRNGRVLSSFDFYNLLLNGDNSEDIRLMTGDVVFIPPITKTVAITGEITRPGIYELKEGESIHDLIHFSGSLKPKADLNSIEIERINTSGNGFTLINVNLNSISPSNLNLNNGDVLNIYPIVNTMQNTILITGYAQQPGFYPWKEGMRISDLLNFPEDLLPMTENNYLIIKRENKTSGLYEIFQVDLEELFVLGDPDENIILQEKDEIIFFSRRGTRGQLLPVLDLLERQTNQTEEEKTITVMGNTYYPGVYPLTNGMTLSDAFKASGGLKEYTLTTDVELIRSTVERKQHKTYKIDLGILTTESLNTKLEPGDIINVKQISRNFRTAEVAGEVFFPGRFPISANETVLDLIKRAGGLKDTAHIKAAMFQRESLREIELLRLKTLQSEARRNILLTQTSLELGDETTMDLGTLNAVLSQNFDDSLVLGRLIIDLKSIVEGTSENLVLENNDTLTIPKTRQIVSVIGEVYVPNSHIFKDGLVVQDYIDMSGGPKKFADIDATYIIKADGSIVTQSSNSRFFRSSLGRGLIETGDTIVLPIQLDKFSALKATTDITQILYQMALATAAVKSF